MANLKDDDLKSMKYDDFCIVNARSLIGRLLITVLYTSLFMRSQRTLTYFVRGSITVLRLPSCLTCLDSAALLMFNQEQIYLLG